MAINMYCTVWYFITSHVHQEELPPRLFRSSIPRSIISIGLSFDISKLVFLCTTHREEVWSPEVTFSLSHFDQQFKIEVGKVLILFVKMVHIEN